MSDICCLAKQTFLIGKHFWRITWNAQKLWFFTSFHVWAICSFRITTTTSKAYSTFVASTASVRVVWEKLWSHTCIAADEEKRKLIWRTYAMLLLRLVLSNAKYDTTVEDVRLGPDAGHMFQCVTLLLLSQKNHTNNSKQEENTIFNFFPLHSFKCRSAVTPNVAFSGSKSRILQGDGHQSYTKIQPFNFQKLKFKWMSNKA